MQYGNFTRNCIEVLPFSSVIIFEIGLDGSVTQRGLRWGFECGRHGFKIKSPTRTTRLLNEFVLIDPRGKYTTLCK